MSSNPVTAGYRAARDLRKRLALSATQRVDPFRIAEELGVIVVWRPLRARNVAGAYLYREAIKQAFILVNSSDGLLRQRFTVCHELGHFLFDPTESVVEELNARQDLSPVERRANAFAAEFLLPEAAIKAYKVLGAWSDSPEKASELALAYGTSYLATLWRLHNAGYITADEAALLRKRYPELSREARDILEQRGAEEVRIPATFDAMVEAARVGQMVSKRRYDELRNLASGAADN